MPRLSVIVPFFNAAPYLSVCVHSLMRQTLIDGVEFLFLDDASTDDSVRVVESVLAQYPDRLPQARIFRSEQHQGVAAMRRWGIQLAQGDYVGWCDADDWCDASMFHTLLSRALEAEADIVTCGYVLHHHDQKVEYVIRRYHACPQTHVRELYRQPDTTLFLWSMLIRRQVLVQHAILPVEGIDIGEDMNLAVRAFCRSERLASVSECLYHHTECNAGSLTRSHNKASRYRYEQDLLNTESICNFLLNEDSEAFRLTTQFFRFLTKWGYDSLLGCSREYFDLYSFTHRDILRFTGLPFWLRLRLAVQFSSYPVYRIFSLICKIRSLR